MTRRCKTRWTTVVIAAATLIVSCATAPRERSLAPSAGSQGAGAPTNDLLANAIYSKLNSDPTYYFRHVDVSVDRGIARLSGYVWSTDAIYGARRIAQSVPGITMVLTTELELERNGRSNGVSR